MSFLACAFGVFTSCSSDDEPSNGTTTGEETTTATFGEVTIKVANASSGSRAASTLLTSLNNQTATSVVRLDNGYVLVTYHGRNQSANDKTNDDNRLRGMVQICDANGTVKSELTCEDARINYAAANGKTVYIGLDKNYTNSGATALCAVATITLTEDYLFPANQTKITRDDIDNLNGVSVNCINVSSDNSIEIATASGDYTTKDGTTKTYTGAFYTGQPKNWTAKDAAAYWCDNSGVRVYRESAHSKNCVATYNGNTIPFTSTNTDTKEEQYGRASATAITVGKYFTKDKGTTLTSHDITSGFPVVFTCGDDLIAWTLSDGSYVNMNAGDTETVKDENNVTTGTKKAEYVAGAYTTAVATDGTYVYACTGNSISKYYLRKYNSGDKYRFEQCYKPVEGKEVAVKFNAKDKGQTGNWYTDNNTYASANHLFVKEGKVYVAFGYEGLVILNADDLSLLSAKDM